jgi:hypothetical protein
VAILFPITWSTHFLGFNNREDKMKVLIALVGCLYLVTQDHLAWDDDYAKVAEEAVKDNPRDSQRVRGIVEGSRRAWASSEDYGHIRESLSHVPHLGADQYRLEMGSPEGGYRVVWVVSDKQASTVYSNLEGPLRAGKVPPESIGTLQGLVDHMTPLDAKSRFDLAVLDGVSYFASTFREHRQTQFVVYAPPLEPSIVGAERERFAVDVEGQTGVIKVLLFLGRRYAKDPIK